MVATLTNARGVFQRIPFHCQSRVRELTLKLFWHRATPRVKGNVSQNRVIFASKANACLHEFNKDFKLSCHVTASPFVSRVQTRARPLRMGLFVAERRCVLCHRADLQPSKSECADNLYRARAWRCIDLHHRLRYAFVCSVFPAPSKLPHHPSAFPRLPPTSR